MTTLQMKRIEKIASQSALFAQKALRKSNELEAYLSLIEYRSGKTRSYKSVRELFKKLQLA